MRTINSSLFKNNKSKERTTNICFVLFLANHVVVDITGCHGLRLGVIHHRGRLRRGTDAGRRLENRSNLKWQQQSLSHCCCRFAETHIESNINKSRECAESQTATSITFALDAAMSQSFVWRWSQAAETCYRNMLSYLSDRYIFLVNAIPHCRFWDVTIGCVVLLYFVAFLCEIFSIHPTWTHISYRTQQCVQTSLCIWQSQPLSPVTSWFQAF